MLPRPVKRLLRPFARAVRSVPGVGQLPGIRRKESRAAAIPPEAKRRKLDRVRRLLRTDLPITEAAGHFDALSAELRKQFNIVDTDNVSANAYDPIALDVIRRHRDGLVLDCGAGLRTEYYENVVNFEIVPYPTTDVLGVGECLPFEDGSFDAAFSLAVLEHVRDPFACAREIARVLKPGGELYCVVPFLQPLHGYPHHYYNMTHQGLRNLFEPHLQVEKQEVLLSGHPIFSLTWYVKLWAAGLTGATRRQFLDLRLGDLLGDGTEYLHLPAVTELPAAVNLELASATALFARKAA